VQTLAAEIHATQRDVTGLLAELSARRREATDVKLQARRHPQLVATLGALLVGTVVVLLKRRIQRRRALKDPVQRRQRLRAAFAKMAEDPDRVRVNGEGMVRGLAMAAGTTFLTSLARRAAHEARLPGRRARIVTPGAVR
jgi:hypothetical protein